MPSAPARRPRHAHPPGQVIAHAGPSVSRLSRVARVIHWGAIGRLFNLRTHKLRRRIAIGLALVALLVASAAIVGVLLANSRPSWWREIDPAGPRRAEIAGAVESGMTTEFTRVRPGGRDDPAAPWSVRLDADSATAWLNDRLPQWLLNQSAITSWPREIDQMQVRFEHGRIEVGVRLLTGQSADPTERYISASLEPSIDEHGALWLRATSLSLGRLPIPLSLALGSTGQGGSLINTTNRIPRELREHPQTRRFLSALAGAEPATNLPVVTLPDGRLVRLLGFQAQGDKLDITCRTEASPR